MKPNFPLPHGATLVDPPEKRAVAGWSEMEYDARCVRRGITWLRVKDGMGRKGDREDWVADLPAYCISVHDYQFRAPYWGLEQYPSFNAAIKGQMKRAIQHANELAEEQTRKAAALRKTVGLLKSAVKTSP